MFLISKQNYRANLDVVEVIHTENLSKRQPEQHYREVRKAIDAFVQFCKTGEQFEKPHEFYLWQLVEGGALKNRILHAACWGGYVRIWHPAILPNSDFSSWDHRRKPEETIIV